MSDTETSSATTASDEGGLEWYEDPSMPSAFTPPRIARRVPTLQCCVVQWTNDSEPGPFVFGCVYDPPDDESVHDAIVKVAESYKEQIKACLKSCDWDSRALLEGIDSICNRIVNDESLLGCGLASVPTTRSSECPSGNSFGVPGVRKGTHVALALWDTRTSAGSSLTRHRQDRRPSAKASIEPRYVGSTPRSLSLGPYPDCSAIHKIQVFRSKAGERTFMTDRFKVILPKIFSRAPLAEYVWDVVTDFQTRSMMDESVGAATKNMKGKSSANSKLKANVKEWSDEQLAGISATLSGLAEKARAAGFNCKLEGLHSHVGHTQLRSTKPNGKSDMYLVLERRSVDGDGQPIDIDEQDSYVFFGVALTEDDLYERSRHMMIYSLADSKDGEAPRYQIGAHHHSQ
jgi:hypothetical protein